MGFFLKVSVAVGMCLGLMHAGYVYRHVVDAKPMSLTGRSAAQHLRGVYYAMWTVGLWLVFGTYVFSLWVLGVILYALTKAIQMVRSVRQLSKP